ncbi:MerR HTH family regulatory protein [Streptoalloteichus tenebrarius]|uniref:MerR HTH family regulatory protein n=2 Tax=Streptoalloteichus tenebrarius (strain ATCC 17920 / DSM 40477 / JCM 4838 / CBS 697.72 / NBRC 16177 / NCIMB 11028 / NRRL B-12390 / A12253. 1 / ISP 5477) TaxID=1933 RepID=A0ABT1HQR9_STRSD|nr:MerR HTH family regulatory protein [Streptoalloteichus tenebrarius]BFE99782.1 MerR family transcriptional regulator [Streptoalloteichus tenebrarius]
MTAAGRASGAGVPHNGGAGVPHGAGAGVPHNGGAGVPHGGGVGGPHGAGAGAAHTQRGGMSIGAVLAQLRPDFPEVTISKIRFLESEGLVHPARTPSGYRQFSPADVERLRFVLAAQRDHYLPLKVIKEQLDALDRGVRPGGPSPRPPRGLVAVEGLPGPDSFSCSGEVRLTREELLADSGVDEGLLSELEQYGLVRPGASGFYDGDAAAVARTVRAMTAFGIEPRHLRAYRAAADREVGLLAQIVTPLARQRDPDARARAEEVVRELAALSVALHTLLVKTGLRGAIGG